MVEWFEEVVEYLSTASIIAIGTCFGVMVYKIFDELLNN